MELLKTLQKWRYYTIVFSKIIIQKFLYFFFVLNGGFFLRSGSFSKWLTLWLNYNWSWQHKVPIKQTHSVTLYLQCGQYGLKFNRGVHVNMYSNVWMNAKNTYEMIKVFEKLNTGYLGDKSKHLNALLYLKSHHR